jgi:hypothetical protein
VTVRKKLTFKRELSLRFLNATTPWKVEKLTPLPGVESARERRKREALEEVERTFGIKPKSEDAQNYRVRTLHAVNAALAWELEAYEDSWERACPREVDKEDPLKVKPSLADMVRYLLHAKIELKYGAQYESKFDPNFNWLRPHFTARELYEHGLPYSHAQFFAVLKKLRSRGGHKRENPATDGKRAPLKVGYKTAYALLDHKLDKMSKSKARKWAEALSKGYELTHGGDKPYVPTQEKRLLVALEKVLKKHFV